MKYLIVQQWNNTKGNHAGMSHMCDLLVDLYPNEYTKIEMDCPIESNNQHNRLIRKILSLYNERKIRKEYLKRYLSLCKDMFLQITPNDEIFLLEYHLKHVPQYDLAKFVKRHFPKNKILALSHLTPTFFSRMKSPKKFILQWSQVIDKQLTLGNSLSSYFERVGLPPQKISTGFHYVDGTYYKRETEISTPKSLTAITMGALQRDFQLLAKVIRNTPRVNWIVCCGKKNVHVFFDGLPNVRTYGYLQENKLKQLMEESNVSVNIMEDTVGSNVITTSMAMGLAIVASDVGSIRDYCSDENAIFCQNTERSFSDALNYLEEHPEVVESKQKSSQQKSSNFHIERIHHWLCSL